MSDGFYMPSKLRAIVNLARQIVYEHDIEQYEVGAQLSAGRRREIALAGAVVELARRAGAR